MEYKEKELKKGIQFHMLKSDKFKTNLIAVFLTTKIERETVTKNAVISATLRRGSKTMPTQEEISKQLEEMYGASFDCGLDKTGDNQVFKFYIETINNNFLPKEGENIFETSLEKILEIVFNPNIENEGFRAEYVEQEKNNIKQMIEAKIDNKARYALDRCVEEMYKEESYGLYKLGYVQDLKEINPKNLLEQYRNLIENCKIDIFVSGNIEDSVEEEVENNENIVKLNEREAKYVLPTYKKEEKQENIIIESMDVSQGKLILGLDVFLENQEQKYDTLVYNAILGGSANSKMFQNVREKEHLAYVASSSYLRYKSNIFINCGIEIENYEKALKVIKEQLEAMKKGDFTEEELEIAKNNIISTIKTIDDEQDTSITYYFGQELSGEKITIEEYQNKIKEINKDDVVKVANSVKINTIYFLKD